MKQKKTEIGILGALFCFGVIYNYMVEWLENRGYHEGYVSYLVVVGSSMTILASIPIIGAQAAIKVFKCFCMSGLPMIIGSCWRHIKHRSQDRDKARAELKEILGGDGFTTKNRAHYMESGDEKGHIG